MDFLFSNLSPVKTKNKTFRDTFYGLIPNAKRIDIAVGYVTTDSLAELKQAVAYNDNVEEINLIIGMHYWDKFTKPEYNAAIGLNDFLTENQRGEVRLVKSFRFHGKLYSYSDETGAFAGIIGSNNLSSIVQNHVRIYEASAIFTEKNDSLRMRDFIELLSERASENIRDCSIDKFNDRSRLLEGHENVKELPPEALVDVLQSLTNVRFEIPLVKNGKVPPESNLNVYFGKGRENKTTGLIKPRPWYEVELMVPNTITALQGYPQQKTPSAEFDVITDDGWEFSCKVSGDFSKNFRSKGDLNILGRWIKGRLENVGALEVGQPVTKETFDIYGRDSFTLTKTTKPNLWYLDFGVGK